MIQENMKASHILHKSYHDKRRKKLVFQEEDHVFLRVTPVKGVDHKLKSKRLTPRFIGLFDIIQRVGEVAYRVVLPPYILNLHEVFHVSQLRKYIPDLSHVIKLDDVQLREKLTHENLLLRTEDRKVKHLQGKEIASVKVVWGRPAGGSVLWELESRMKESYPVLY
ncbi:uncharacterized protein LOC127107009 [Lathyrus oleraceus]|uniref:uncharacterized protein LOC127107009 n=1 Tax=Pisum sativum TaxID=3888 RepID=UPI0021CEED5A|nr:uncharacterized protein LOC127107009 [Pisum sativum]